MFLKVVGLFYGTRISERYAALILRGGEGQTVFELL